MQEALDSASILWENRKLEHRIEAQNQELSELKSQLENISTAATLDKNKCSAALLKLKNSYAMQLEEAEAAKKSQLEAVQAKLESERLEKAALEAQLADEKKGAQGLLMNFGEQHTEAQWKRKINHLRSEHRDLQQERDHYKRLCLSLQPSIWHLKFPLKS